jgi:hypothetical protein
MPVDTNKSSSRRKFLKKAGALAVYTPPAMVALMQPSKAAVANSFKLPGNQDLPSAGDHPSILKRLNAARNNRRNKRGRNRPHGRSNRR